tara:strand:+ start:106 stop:711 length:606 start_codon:yes stop_codon:yes gene_type:complete
MNKKYELSEIQKIDGYYNYNHLIQPLATQLMRFIPDYDICIIIAKYYLQIRPYDSVQNDREFYMSRIWEAKNTGSIGTLSPLKMRLHLWNPDYIEWRESAKKSRSYSRQTDLNIKKNKIKPLIDKYMIRYLASSKGIRDITTTTRGPRELRTRWKCMAVVWGIKNIDKGEITLKDKLDDLKYIPYENLIRITRSRTFIERN